MHKVSYKAIAIFIMAMASFLIAALQPMGYSPDYTNYEGFFQQLRFGLELDDSRFEPGFVLLSAILISFIQSNVIVYSALVLLAVYLKLYFCIRRATAGAVATVAILYLFKFLPLHELTQLRVALAAAFMAGAFYYAGIRNHAKTLLFCIFGFLFHYSSLILAPFLFPPYLTRRQIGVAFILIFTAINMTAALIYATADATFSVFALYDNPIFTENRVNPLSPVFFPEFFLILFSLLYWNHLTTRMKQAVAFQIFGFAVFFATLEFSVISVRSREFFSVMWLFYVSDINLVKLKVRLAIIFFIVLSTLLSFYLFIFNDFFTPIASWQWIN